MFAHHFVFGQTDGEHGKLLAILPPAVLAT